MTVLACPSRWDNHTSYQSRPERDLLFYILDYRARRDVEEVELTFSPKLFAAFVFHPTVQPLLGACSTQAVEKYFGCRIRIRGDVSPIVEFTSPEIPESEPFELQAGEPS